MVGKKVRETRTRAINKSTMKNKNLRNLVEVFLLEHEAF